MSKPKRMDQIKAIIETYLNTKSIKSTARRLQVSKNTVKAYNLLFHSLPICRTENTNYLHE